MERKIVIVSNKTQAQYVIEKSTAATLGELKSEMRAKGIDYEGMSFYEGHARVELKDDNSVLPTNIPYKGQVVNDLTFLLSAPDKKIKSGVLSRKEVYEQIKARNLGEEVKRQFGRNCTQVPTADLLRILESTTKKERNTSKEVKKAAPETTAVKAEGVHVGKSCPSLDQLESAFVALIDTLRGSGYLSAENHAGILSVLRGEEWKRPEGMSQEEINEMFNFVR